MNKEESQTAVYRNEGQRGDVAIYISLMMLAIMLSGALLYSLVLARQIRATGAAIDSERAFYAANTGVEHGLYLMAKQFQEAVDDVSGSVLYPSRTGGGGSEATYAVGGTYEVNTGKACLHSRGEYRRERRNLEVKDIGCP